MNGFKDVTKIVGYARISSRHQIDGTSALEQQIARLKAAGAEDIFIDIESGRSDRRPQFQKLMKLVDSKAIAKVIITRLDRLARNLPATRKAIERFIESGVTLIALDDALDFSSASGKFQLNILAALAEMESDRLSERIKHGKAYSREKHRAWQAPFGYRVVNYQLVINREPFLCTLRDRKEYSQYNISRWVINEYIERRSLYRVCQESTLTFGWALFGQASLKRWLTSPVIYGNLCYFPKSSNPQVVRNTHEAIALEEELDLIKSILDFNRQIRGFGNRGSVYSMTGLVKCVCGSGCVVANGMQGQYKYFACYRRQFKECDRKWIRIERLEEAVIEALCSASEKIAIACDVEGQKKELPEVTQLKQQIDALCALPSNPIIDDAIARLRNQLQQLLHGSALEVKHPQRQLLERIAGDKHFWESLTPTQTQRFFRELVDCVIVDGRKIVEVRLRID